MILDLVATDGVKKLKTTAVYYPGTDKRQELNMTIIKSEIQGKLAYLTFAIYFSSVPVNEIL